MKVAQEIHRGLIKPNAAVRKYGFCHWTIDNCLIKYIYRGLSAEEVHSAGDNPRPDNKAKFKRIKDLERALATAKLKIIDTRDKRTSFILTHHSGRERSKMTFYLDAYTGITPKRSGILAKRSKSFF